MPRVGLPAKSRGAVAGAGARVARCGPGPGITGRVRRGGARRRPGKDKWADASAGSARWRAGAGSGSQVLLQLLEGPPAGAGQRASSTRRITSAPGAAVDAIPPAPCRARGLAGGSEFTGHGAVRRAGNPGHPLFRPLAPPREERPGHHRDPRSNHVVRRYAFYYRHGRRRRAPGAGPPAGAGQHQAQLTRPPPANHRVGRRQGRQAQAPTGPPRTPGPAASRRRPDRRTPRRPN